MKAYPSVSTGGTVRTSLVVYLDILGFRALMGGTTTPQEATTALARVRAALDAAGLWIKGNGPIVGRQVDEYWAVRAFTDNIVIGYPLTAPGGHGEPELGSTFMHLAFFQLTMIQQGFFVRGAIGLGDLYIDEELVYGKALLEVYDVEQRQASTPRIVLAPSAVALVDAHMKFYTTPADSPHSRELLRDRDGLIFLDYLASTILVDEVDSGPALHDLAAHRNVVIEKLREFKNDPRIWPKYEWAGRYHNYFCDSHQIDAQYKVPPSDLEAMPQPFA